MPSSRSFWPFLLVLGGLGGSGGGVSCTREPGTIGAVLGQRADGRLFVREAPPGLAARRAGVVPGDEILLIDGRDVRAMDDRELHRALSGEEGAPVKLTLVRNEAVIRVTLARTPARERRGP